MQIQYWKLIFFILMIISIFIVISSNSWFNMWLGLEINLMSIIPLMNNHKNFYTTETSLKYFITQALASTIILMSMILIYKNLMLININAIMLNSGLLIKMGSAPFHFWFPEVMEGLNWMMTFIMLTVQKITPFCILNYNMNYSMFFYFIIILNMMISALMGLNQVSLRKILAFSSINHIGWMISSMMFMKTLWIHYFLIYSFILINLILMFNIFNIFYMKQISMMMNYSMITKLIFMFNFMSLGGLPPFLGFYPKWLTIQMISPINPSLIILMIILTMITLFYYLRLMFPMILLNNPLKKIKIINMKWNNTLIFLSIFSFPIPLIFFML